ncbi:hypothetical protein [Streptomyces hiroshimensis]|uniref:Uncharacterized protein n=1 Tax=Streptomyces hiroshimensis TaxID=66424 RepID=A0ABQ2Z9U7_9ACTN|nr:hypothetical protein [Streptomyces hiroshimensis]GGY06627.1 hypothetical protein GCM10010324_61760 [Streptomyces hiroshimensis]
MLAQLPLAHLLLMAAAATLVLCLAIDRWTKSHKLAVVVLVASVGCCLGMIGAGGLQAQHWNARQMLVMYSFTWAGFTIGLLPSRRLFLTYGEEWRRGVKRDKYEYPARCRWAVYVSVIAMGLLAFFLAT